MNPTGWVDPEGQTTYNTMRSIPGFEKHHIIPQQLRAHPVLKAADFKIHELNNVIHLPKYAESHPVRTIHRGPHPSYSKKIKGDLNMALELGSKNNWNTTQYRNAADDLVMQNRQDLRRGKTLLNKASIRGGGTC
nr:AHH domain-containing protein [Pseudomonas sp. SDI]